MTKAEARKIFLQKRLALSEAEYLHLNQLLCDRFFALTDLSGVSVLHIFLPIAQKKEPDTWLIADRMRREFPQIHLAVPRMNGDNLEHFLLESPNQISANRWGVPEPQYGQRVAVEKIDMVLVPLLAFDVQGHRIGYGKGYYDRFLKNCTLRTQRIGLSFFPPLQHIAATDNDVKLTSCITPEDFFVFA